MKLTERETAALRALAGSDTPLSSIALAEAMRAGGLKANKYGAPQSANGLVNKGLAVKKAVAGETGALIGYELTDAGRNASAGLGGTS